MKGLNMIYLVNTTVHLCTSRDLLWDPKKDLLWLCQKYGREIESKREQLNSRQVKENFLGTAFFSAFSVEEQRLCYHVLLGKEPPPSMFLTPAPAHPRPTGTAARPPIPSHKSEPSLKDNAQSDLLKPLMHGKSKPSPIAAISGPSTKARPKRATNSQLEETTTGSTHDSRSRYRTSSAPTTPSVSRDVSPEARPTQKTMEFRLAHMQRHSMIYQAQSVKIQNLATASKPQVVQTKKSLPRVGHAMNAQAVPVFAHKTTQHTYSQTNLVAGKEPSEPFSQPHGKLSKANTRNSAAPSATSAQPHVVAHTHPAHRIIAQRNLILPKGSAEVTAASAVSDSVTTKLETPLKGPAIVGPEGLYPTPPKATIQANKTQSATPAMHTSQGFVFELDAASPQVETFFKATPATYHIAELPGGKDLPPQQRLQRHDALPETPISPPQGSTQPSSKSTLSNSPVSPPAAFPPLAIRVQSTHSALNIERPEATPTQQATKLAPSPPVFDMLPPSLMIGFRGSQQKPRPRAETQSSNGSNPPVAPTKYQRYYSTPNGKEVVPNTASISTPNSRHSSPNRGPIYQAYTPPITPPVQPKSEFAFPQQSPPTSHGQMLTPPAVNPSSLFTAQETGPVSLERASGLIGRVSPPNILRAGANLPTPLKVTKDTKLPNPLAANPPTPQNASHMKHDSHHVHNRRAVSANHTVLVNPYFTGAPQGMAHAPPPHSTATQYIAFSTQHTIPTEPRPSSLHQRNTSTASNTSTTSHDSERMAEEYRMDLPSFDNGLRAHTETRGSDSELKKLHRPSHAETAYGLSH